MIVNEPQMVTEQLHRTSSVQVACKFTEPINVEVMSIICAIGAGEYSLIEILEIMGLKHRASFAANYLKPAIRNGFVTPLFPNSPNHPRQKYLLTQCGMVLYRGAKS